jgi:DNA-binding response OmpR family regulator
VASLSKIACVELDEDFYYLIRSYIERCGLEAEFFQREAVSLEKIMQLQPVAILIEADHLSGIPTWDWLSLFNEDARSQNIPVIVSSWFYDRATVLAKGADVFLQKPVMFADFQDALASAGVCVVRQNIDNLPEKRR